MTADYSHYEHQLRQRLTSTSLITMGAWLGRLPQEILRRLSGDLATVSGVLSGLQVNVVANTLTVAVGGGIGCFYDATKVAPESQHRWIEIPDGVPIIATLDPGGGNPRWDVVEIAPGVADGTAQFLDVYNPNTGAFTPTALSPLKVCTPVVTVRKGTEAASPKLPAGIAGVMPLAYVYVAAGAVMLNVDRIMRCAPRIMAREGIYRGEDPTSPLVPTHQETISITGGGFLVEADGDLTGPLARAMSGRFQNGGLPFFVGQNAPIGISAVGNYAGGGLPGTGTVYLYVAPPPYPAGYDAHLAPRELFINDFTTPGINATIPAGARNCILVGAGHTPTVSALGYAGAPHVTTAFVDNGIFGNFTLQRSRMLYVGAAYYDAGLPGFVAQRMAGAWVGPKRKTGNKFDGDLPIVAPAIYSVTSAAAGDPAMALPNHVTRVDLVFNVQVGPPTAWFQLEWFDQFETQGSNSPRLLMNVHTNANDINDFYSHRGMAVLGDLGEIAIVFADGSLTGDAYVHVYAYEDAVLALR